jgi:hypothetical protein
MVREGEVSAALDLIKKQPHIFDPIQINPLRYLFYYYEYLKDRKYDFSSFILIFILNGYIIKKKTIINLILNYCRSNCFFKFTIYIIYQ